MYISYWLKHMYVAIQLHVQIKHSLVKCTILRNFLHKQIVTIVTNGLLLLLMDHYTSLHTYLHKHTHMHIRSYAYSYPHTYNHCHTCAHMHMYITSVSYIFTSTILTKMYSDSNAVVSIFIISSSNTALV